MPVTCFNLRDVVSCQSNDLSFLLAVLFNFVYLLLINLYYYYNTRPTTTTNMPSQSGGVERYD